MDGGRGEGKAKVEKKDQSQIRINDSKLGRTVPEPVGHGFLGFFFFGMKILNFWFSSLTENSQR